ncbi:AraC family transcriptional regulator [Actinomadura livida]|uniref:AraC family transcriptional regulator n=1 Tax=Actinomadura livida TaxID=79909 RepID=A0A7W7MY44_9ACTN|nr:MULTISPECIES: AraC family transcriptional regulator [Actinomadura]MBB4774472.1 AraC-like DNA-binding protein [Actinomadura catellatispora]GGT82294.1 cupin [Actinomadura livida]
MDPFDDLLKGVRGEGAAFGTSSLAAQCGLRFTDGAPLTLCVLMRGEGVLRQGDLVLPFRTGEAAIVRGPEPFVFADADAPRTVCDAGDVSMPEAPDEAVLLTASYRLTGEVARRLVAVLPPMIVVPDDHDCASMRGYLEAQLDACRPGRQVVLDRLLDWLLVCTLRDWFDRPEAVRPGWYQALGDPVVGPALRAIHADPGRPWTLASLAAAAHASRTTLARRFTELVGEPPLAYLTGWRMALATERLMDPSMTVATVAREVGYTDAFAFSSAFKRTLGKSPTAYRQDAARTASPHPASAAQDR